MIQFESSYDRKLINVCYVLIIVTYYELLDM